MRHHQRYFSVEDGPDQLAPEFVAVMNTRFRSRGLVRTGNERVLRARFNDARFFWDVDQQRKLVDRLEDLKNVTFQAKLGSYLEKTERMVAARDGIRRSRRRERHDVARAAAAFQVRSHRPSWSRNSPSCRASSAGSTRASRASRRSLARDLRPLQACQHGGLDSLARSPARVVALADKLDTLRGCFAIGLIPTGSRDPFALRRAAQGVVKILVEGKLRTQALRRCSARTRSFANS